MENFDIADKVCYGGRETEIISILPDNFYLLAGVGNWVSGDKIKLVAISETHEPNISFKYNDGGREAAGFKGDASDCVCRSIAIVTDRNYREIYDYLASHHATQRKSKHQKKRNRKSAKGDINTNRKWFKDYMRLLGFEWVATMKVGEGCNVHLKKDELPKGRLVVVVSKHLTAVVDGVINDTFDCSRDGTRCVYGYYKLND